MKNTSFLMKTSRSILLAGMMFGAPAWDMAKAVQEVQQAAAQEVQQAAAQVGELLVVAPARPVEECLARADQCRERAGVIHVGAILDRARRHRRARSTPGNQAVLSATGAPGKKGTPRDSTRTQGPGMTGQSPGMGSSPSPGSSVPRTPSGSEAID